MVQSVHKKQELLWPKAENKMQNPIRSDDVSEAECRVGASSSHQLLSGGLWVHRTGNVQPGDDPGGRLHRPCAGEADEEGRGAPGRLSLAIIADAPGQ